MTDKMTAAEALERAQVWFRHYDIENLVGALGGFVAQDKAALSVLSALVEDHDQNRGLIADLTRDMNEYHDRAEKAEAENERLTERATWFKNVNADWEAWAERSEKERGVLAAENAALKAEVERAKQRDLISDSVIVARLNEIKNLKEILGKTFDRAETAEAHVKTLTEFIGSLQAELSKWTPLVEAVMSGYAWGITEGAWILENEKDILRAALAVKEQMEKANG